MPRLRCVCRVVVCTVISVTLNTTGNDKYYRFTQLTRYRERFGTGGLTQQ